MPKNLTETPTFAPDITVPEGDDSRDDAAGDVELLAQQLANRTAYLRVLADAAALRPADNTFTGANTLTQELNVKPTIASRWNLVGRFKSADPAGPSMDGPEDAQYVYLYTGTDSSNTGAYGAFALTFNAKWRASATGGYPNGHWDQLDYTRASFALIMRGSEIRLASKPANEQDWTEWPGVLNLNTLGGSLLSEALFSERTYAQANFDATQSNGFRYQGARNRTSSISNSAMYGDVYYFSDGSVGHHALSVRNASDTGSEVVRGGDANKIWIPIRVPPYCSFGPVRVRLQQGQTSGWDTFQLKRRIGTGNWADVGAAETIPHGGDYTGTLHPSTWVTQLENEQWAYVWSSSNDSSAANNKIYAVEVDWSDIGPSNGLSS